MRMDAPAPVAGLARCVAAAVASSSSLSRVVALEARIRRRLALLRGRYGVVVEQPEGWRLRFAPEWLDAALLPDGACVVDEATSALDIARESKMNIGAPVFCEWQTRGRGRRGRRWLSIPGGAIMFAMRVPAPPAPLGLTLALGVGVLQALEAEGCAGLQLKWPNDIVNADGCKVGGILTEGVRDGTALVGVGINVLMTPELRTALGRPAAGLLSSLTAPQHRNRRAYATAKAALLSAERFARDGVGDFLSTALARHIAAPGEELCFRGGDGELRRGEFAGFGARGELLLRGKHGVAAHISGEFEDDDAAGG